MASSPRAEPSGHEITRRTFLHGGSAAALTAACVAPARQRAAAREATGDERRNRQPSMAYRRLGRTGLMISEVVCGGDPIRPGNCKHVELAIEMGLNYLDMAPAYGRGDCERAYGTILAGSSKRRRVFLNTKISHFDRARNALYKEIFDGLPPGKQQAILRRSKALRAQRGVDKPGYYLSYFPGQTRELDASYLSNAMMRDYRHRVEGSLRLRKIITDSIEGSLKRVGTDHFDLMMCPHGASSPEELRYPEIFETFTQLNRQGKVRFLGVSAHNDPAGILRAAAQSGHYDVVMMAYNVINGGHLEEAIRQAKAKDVGVIAMKVAMAVATQHRALQPIPPWRIQKLNRLIPGPMKPPMKAYVWALQNPNISAVISNLWDETYVRENLSLAGKKVTLQPA